MTKIDSDLGKPLPEKSYGSNCLIYDANRPESPWHNVWDKMDGFVVVHFIGWWLKVSGALHRLVAQGQWCTASAIGR